MLRNRLTRITLTVTTVAMCLLLVSAWSRTAAAQERPVVKPIPEVTMTGRVVDLYCAMTGEHPDKDIAKCTAECIKKGVPAALETPTGLILLGHGMQSPAPKLVPYAYQEVELKGKLYDKHGIKYLDVLAIKPLGEKPAPPPVEPEDEPEGEPGTP